MGFKARQLAPVVGVAFTQGAMDFQSVASLFYYKNVFRVSASHLSLLQGFIYLPWALKPFMGIITDNYPLFGFRRKSYLIVACLCELACMLAIGLLPPYLPLVFTLQFVASANLVFRNVIGEGIVVETSREEMHAHPERTPEQHQYYSQRAVSCFFGSRAFGSLIFSFLGGLALKVLTISQVFLICALFSATLLLLIIFVYEERREESAAMSPSMGREAIRSLKTVWRALTGGPVRWLLLAVCVSVANPSIATTFTYYYTEMLGFSPTRIGLIALCSNAAYLFGVLVFNFLLSELPFRAFYIATSTAIGLFDLTTLLLLFEIHRRIGLSDLSFVLLTSSFSSLLTEINFLPVLAVGCRICPPGLEATTYAVFTALFNTAGYVSTMLGSLFVFALHVQEKSFRNLWVLVVGHSVYALLVTAAMGFVDFRAAISTPLAVLVKKDQTTEEKIASAIAVSTSALEYPRRVG